MISKDTFCKALQMLLEQERIDNAFEEALQTIGDGHFVYGSNNKYREALLMVLKESVDDKYDYIDWWLYDGAPEYKVWTEDEKKTWILKTPEALYDYITTECE